MYSVYLPIFPLSVFPFSSFSQDKILGGGYRNIFCCSLPTIFIYYVYPTSLLKYRNIKVATFTTDFVHCAAVYYGTIPRTR